MGPDQARQHQPQAATLTDASHGIVQQEAGGVDHGVKSARFMGSVAMSVFSQGAIPVMKRVWMSP